MGEMVSFSSNGGTAEGYLAVPDTGAGPAVIVIQELWGLVGHVTDVVDRFAGEGFVALAPDLYHGKSTSEPDEARKLNMGLAMDAAARDIAGAATYLTGRVENTGRGIGCVGFCLGGSLALWSATLSQDIIATVGFYPALPWARMSPTWSRYAGKHAMIHADSAEGGTDAEGIQRRGGAVRLPRHRARVLQRPTPRGLRRNGGQRGLVAHPQPFPRAAVLRRGRPAGR